MASSSKVLFSAVQLGLAVWLWLVSPAAAAPAFDTTTPASFFTNVANQVLRSQTAGWAAQNFAGYTNTYGVTTTGPFGITNIPVWVNGSFVYSPAIQRLLQVTANIYDATSTNPYPSVFRPGFYRDPATGNVFINGYQLVPSVSGLGDPALASPVGIAALVSGNLPVTAPNGQTLALNNVNIYGVPWIIGAKKGLPSFNELYMLNLVQVTRRLQVNRPGVVNGGYTTNEMFIMSITNLVGMSCWNSYTSNYVGSGNLTVYMEDTMRMVLTNAAHPPATLGEIVFTNIVSLSSWPGSDWSNSGITPALVSVNPASFVSQVFTNAYLPASAYQTLTGHFIDLTNNPPWETNVVSNYPFPQFGLVTTNWAQVVILDGSNVLDYVQLAGPNNARNITAELADPNSPGLTGTTYMWSTNAYGRANTSGVPTFGEANQIFVSRGIGGLAVPPGGTWSTAISLGGDNSVSAQQAYFNAFWSPSGLYNLNGIIYTNTATTVRAPFTPTRTMYDYTLWQANDPLVHYLACDLNYNYPGQIGLQQSDTVPPILNVSSLNLNQVGNRYQPWGVTGQMAEVAGVDTNQYNPAYKDPLVWGSDDWNFPVGQTWNPNWLGQVHRGTPWQSIYLKSANVLSELLNEGGGYHYIGTNTWENWTGVTNPEAADETSPINDWRLASLLAALLNTNASPAFFSVNNPDPNAWAAQFAGLTALTNSLPYANLLLSSNSPAVAAIVSGIQATRASQSGQVFQDAGDLLATPQLSVQSPFLDLTDPYEPEQGISDQAYEALPSQLLAQLGLASLGTVTTSAGRAVVQFTGTAGRLYALQSSADLIHWTTLSTNAPANGLISFPLPAPVPGVAQFYRSVLLP